jgi:hypothetical protein
MVANGDGTHTITYDVTAGEPGESDVVPNSSELAGTEIHIPVVPGAASAELWYRSGDHTWEAGLSADVFSQEAVPPSPDEVGLGSLPTVPVVVSDDFGQVHGVVVAYRDADGKPFTVHGLIGGGALNQNAQLDSIVGAFDELVHPEAAGNPWQDIPAPPSDPACPASAPTVDTAEVHDDAEYDRPTFVPATCSEGFQMTAWGGVAAPGGPEQPWGDTPEAAVRTFLKTVLGDEEGDGAKIGPARPFDPAAPLDAPGGGLGEQAVTLSGGASLDFEVLRDAGTSGWFVYPKSKVESIQTAGPWAAKGVPAGAASTINVPSVPGAASARLIYRAGADTLQADLDAKVLAHIPGPEDAEGVIPLAVPGQVEGYVLVSFDAAGHPISIEAITSIGPAAASGAAASDAAGGGEN